MNLNADAGENITFDHLFNENPDQLDLVDNTDQINPKQPNKDTLVIVNTDGQSDPAKPTATELFGSPLVKNELPNFNAEFIDVTKNNYNTTTDLIEVYNGLIQANGVSKEDISLVDSISPGFINDKNPIGFYTEERSKTQYKKALESLDKEIDARIGIIAQASIDYLDKAHEKYSALISLLEKDIIDKVVSLQLEVQALSLKVNKEDKHINETLESTVGRYVDQDCDYYKKLPSNINKAMMELSNVFGPGDSFLYKLSALYRSQLNTDSETWFTIGDSRELTSVHKERPYFGLVQTDKTHGCEDAIHSLHIHTTLAIGADTLDQIKTLTGAAIGVVTDFPTYKEQIKLLSSSADKPKDKILEELYGLSSANSKDALVVLTIVNFLETFICYLEKLKAVYSAISDRKSISTESRKEKYKVSKEGFFDLFKKKKKEEPKDKSLKEIIKDNIKQVEDNTEDQIKVTYNKLNDSFKLDQLEKELLLLKKCRDINLKYLNEYPKWLNSYYKVLSKIPRNRDEILKIYAKCRFEADSLISKEYKTLPNLKKEVTNNEKIVTSKNNVFKIILSASALETAREAMSFDEYDFVSIPYVQIKILSEDKPEETSIQINKKNLLDILNTLHELCDVEQEFNETPLKNNISDVAFDLQELSEDSRDDEEYVTMGHGAGEDYYQGFPTNILFEIERTIETLFKKINIKF